MGDIDDVNNGSERGEVVPRLVLSISENGWII